MSNAGNIFGISLVNVNIEALDKLKNFTTSVTGTTSITGSVNANSFVKAGGTNTQYLMADGSVPTTSSGNQGSNIYLYINSTALVGIPAPSYIQFNNVIQQSATNVYISYQSRYTIDIDAFLSLINSTSIIYIQDMSDASNYIKFSVNSMTQVQNSYTTVSVTYLSGEGTGLTSFGNDTNIFLSVFTDGVEIDNRLTTTETNIVTNTSAIATEITNRTHADALKLNLSGGTITGNIDVGVNKITSSYVPVANTDLTNKLYIDGQVSAEATLRTNADALKLNLSGGTITGLLIMV